MKTIPIPEKEINASQLHEEIAAQLGDNFIGVRTNSQGIDLLVEDKTSDQQMTAAFTIAENHKPVVVPPPLTLEERVAALERLVQSLLSK